MPGNSDQLEHPAAEIEADDLPRPLAETVKVADVLGRVADDGGVRSARERRAAVAVIVVAVGVRDHELVAVARVLGEPCVDESTVARSGTLAGSALGPVSSRTVRSFPNSRKMNGASKLTALLTLMMTVCRSLWCTWIAGSAHCLRAGAPWIHAGSSAPAIGAAATKSMTAGFPGSEGVTGQ